MKRARLLTALIGTVAVCATLRAHGRIVIVMDFDPAKPVYAEDCTVTVRFVSTAGDAVRVASERVQLVATMSGHAMRPVEAVLTPGSRAGEFVGAVRFTMAGPWNIAVNASSDHDALSGTAQIEVLPEPPVAAAIPQTREPIVLQTGPDPTARPGWAWPALLATILVTLLAETIAFSRKTGLARRKQ